MNKEQMMLVDSFLTSIEHGRSFSIIVAQTNGIVIRYFTCFFGIKVLVFSDLPGESLGGVFLFCTFKKGK